MSIGQTSHTPWMFKQPRFLRVISSTSDSLTVWYGVPRFDSYSLAELMYFTV